MKKSSPGRWNPYGAPYSEYHESAFEPDFFVLNMEWGYFSKKDYLRHEAVLCEGCYDIVFKDVKIKVTDLR